MATIDRRQLSVAFQDTGAGMPVLPLHFWPNDASDGVAPALNAAGLRTAVPMLGGFGATRFRDDAAPRTGNSGILAISAVAPMDALGIDRFMVAGHDRGANIAEALAVAGRTGLQRCRRDEPWMGQDITTP